MNHLLITAFTIVGFHICIKKGQILYWYTKYILLYERLPEWLFKPLGGCVTCMASIFGTISFWLKIIHEHQIVNSYTLISWVVFCFSLAILNSIIYYFYVYLKDNIQIRD